MSTLGSKITRETHHSILSVFWQVLKDASRIDYDWYLLFNLKMAWISHWIFWSTGRTWLPGLVLDSLWSLQFFSPVLLSAYAASEKKRRPSTCSISCQVYKEAYGMIVTDHHDSSKKSSYIRTPFLPSGERARRKLIIVFSFFLSLFLLTQFTLKSSSTPTVTPTRDHTTDHNMDRTTIEEHERSFSFGFFKW